MSTPSVYSIPPSRPDIVYAHIERSQEPVLENANVQSNKDRAANDADIYSDILSKDSGDFLWFVRTSAQALDINVFSDNLP